MKFIIVPKLPTGAETVDADHAVWQRNGEIAVFTRVGDNWSCVTSADDLTNLVIRDVGNAIEKTDVSVSTKLDRVEQAGVVLGLMPEYVVAGQSSLSLATEGLQDDLRDIEIKTKTDTTRKGSAVLSDELVKG